MFSLFLPRGPLIPGAAAQPSRMDSGGELKRRSHVASRRVAAGFVCSPSVSQSVRPAAPRPPCPLLSLCCSHSGSVHS